jgi:peptide/nickel transport system substrate-binding protein
MIAPSPRRFLSLLAVAALLAGPQAWAEPAPAIAMHGTPVLPNHFKNLAYANPDAPKGGRLIFGLLGSFDSLNPFIVKGIAVQQIRGYVVESLMARNNDEPFSLYGLLADRIETDDARSYVAFHINPAARFSDGTPVTAQDVLFSWQLMRDHGRPNHRLYYSKAKEARALDTQTVRFDFGGEADRELPLILGLMPVFSQKAVNVDTFEDTSMTAPLGSGPYRVTEVRPGASVTLTRNPN